MEQSEASAAAKPKKKGKLLRVVIGVVGVVGVAAGGALYAQSAGLIHLSGVGGGNKAVEPDRPHLVPRSGVTPTSYAVRGARPVEASQFQISYYPMLENFTANLRDDGGFIQIGLGVSTYYDEQVFQNLERHEMAVRSAVLMQLADQDPIAVTTPQGKIALKARLTKAINDVLTEKEGFGGIDDVYFTGFVIQ